MNSRRTCMTIMSTPLKTVLSVSVSHTSDQSYVANPKRKWSSTNADWAAFSTAVTGLNVNIIKVGRIDTLIDYVNNKTGGDSRATDLITKFTVFSHGWDATMALGYDYTKNYNKSLNFNSSDISQINGSAFDNPASWFGSCNLGTGGADSFGQAWVNQVGGTTWAFEGKTTYEYIMYPQGYSKFKPWHWATRSTIINARKNYGFSISGSYRYPGAGTDAREVMFTR